MADTDDTTDLTEAAEALATVATAAATAILDHLPAATVEAILASPDLEAERFDVPQWGSSLVLKGLSKRGANDLRRNSTVDGEPDVDLLEQEFFVSCVIEPTFTREQYQQLLDKSADAVNTVIRRVMEINGQGAKATDKAEARFQEGT